jgi:iron complex transport system ATP-binding protein
MLEALRVSVVRGGVRVVADVSLAVHPGEVLAVLGPNGAGKSTLLDALAGEVALSHGSVQVNSAPIRHLPALERARVRALMPQSSVPAFGFTSFEIALLGRYPHCRGHPGRRDREIAHAALARTDATHLAARLVTTLSGGERARVQLARVLTQLWEPTLHARYLLLDEPTASLDLAHQHLALRIARRCAEAEGFGVVAVLHDLNLAARYADRVVLLRAGRVHALGRVDAVLHAANIAACFDVEAIVLPHPRGSTPVIVTG